jgi:hypothetical protein
MIRLTVAFADREHARVAVRFLAGSSLSVTAVERPINDDADLALVDIQIPDQELTRLETLIAGAHGIVIREPLQTAASAA